MEKERHCWHCDEKHIVSETKDGQGNVVGLFCNRNKAMIVAKTTRWNGEDIYPQLERFLERNVDTIALVRICGEKINGLSRKMTYLFLQTEYAKERGINYYWAQYHALSIVRRMRATAANRVGG